MHRRLLILDKFRSLKWSMPVLVAVEALEFLCDVLVPACKLNAMSLLPFVNSDWLWPSTIPLEWLVPFLLNFDRTEEGACSLGPHFTLILKAPVNHLTVYSFCLSSSSNHRAFSSWHGWLTGSSGGFSHPWPTALALGFRSTEHHGGEAWWRRPHLWKKRSLRKKKPSLYLFS